MVVVMKEAQVSSAMAAASDVRDQRDEASLTLTEAGTILSSVDDNRMNRPDS